ncbi:hypothetical protein ACXGQW_11580 [Wenyingzhuangia sp. IMCC45533]
MKPIIIRLVVFCSLLIAFNTYSFSIGDIYVIKLGVLKYLIKKKDLSDVYAVKETKTVTELKNTVKEKSTVYINLQKQVNLLEQEKIKYVRKYDSILIVKQEFDQISENILSFLKSSKPVAEKKGLLKEAQVIATKYGIKDLIYADKEMDPARKSKFLVLSLNPIDHKFHLKKVLKNLKQEKVVKEIPKYNDKKLNTLKTKLRNTAAYEYKEVYGGKLTNQTLTAQGKVKDLNLVAGKFEELREAYLIVDSKNPKLPKNSIISEEEFAVADIDKVKFLKLLLIKNVENGAMLMVEENHLQTYGYKIN